MPVDTSTATGRVEAGDVAMDPTAMTHMATVSIDTDTVATVAAPSLGKDHTGNPLKVDRVRVRRACIRRSVVMCMGTHTMAIELG